MHLDSKRRSALCKQQTIGRLASEDGALVHRFTRYVGKAAFACIADCCNSEVNHPRG